MTDIVSIFQEALLECIIDRNLFMVMTLSIQLEFYSLWCQVVQGGVVQYLEQMKQIIKINRWCVKFFVNFFSNAITVRCRYVNECLQSRKLWQYLWHFSRTPVSK